MYEDTKYVGLEADSQYIQLAAEVFSLFSDEARIHIILALRTGECSVNELVGLIEKSPTTVLQHLVGLRWYKVVRPRQEGTRVYYSLIDEHAHEFVTHAVFQAEHVMEIVPPHHTVQDFEAAFGGKAQEGNLRPQPKHLAPR